MALLERILHDFPQCPICGTGNSVQITGRRRSTLECAHCDAQWSAGTYDDTGDPWLMLTKPSNTQVGTVKVGLLNRACPLDFWLHPKKPFLKLERYAGALYDAFQDFETLKREFGEVEFKGGREGIRFIGPSIHIVATIQIMWDPAKDYALTLGVIDQTPLLKAKDRDKDSLFCYMIRKKLHLLTEETGIPLTPYLARSWKEGAAEVPANAFHPFKDLEEVPVVFPAGTPKWHRDVLIAYSLLTPKTEKKPVDTLPEAPPAAAPPTAAPPAAAPPAAAPLPPTPRGRAQRASLKRAPRLRTCAICGNPIPHGAPSCPTCNEAPEAPAPRTVTTYLDEFHKERTALSDFTALKGQLQAQGKLLVGSKKPLTAAALRGADLLVIGGPEHPWMFGRGGDKWSSTEVKAIQRFVARGGALLMLGDGLGSAEEMTAVTAPYGIAFSGDSVGEVTLAQDDLTPHPLTEGVHTICFGAVLKSGGKYLDVTAPAIVLARHEGRPVFAYREQDLGCVAVLSSLSAFSNKYLEQQDNRTLLTNLLQQLPRARRARDVPPAAETPQPPPPRPAPEPVEAPTPVPEAAPSLVSAGFCPNCGTPVVSGAVFCGICGYRLTAPEGPMDASAEATPSVPAATPSVPAAMPPSWEAPLTSWVALSDEWEAVDTLFQEEAQTTADATFPRDRTALIKAWERDISHWQPTFLDYENKELQLWDAIKKAPDLPDGAFSLIHTLQVNRALAVSRRQELVALLKRQLKAMRDRDHPRVNALFAEVLQWIKAQHLLRNDYADLLTALRAMGIPIPSRHIPATQVIRDEDYELGKHVIKRLVPVPMPAMVGRTNPWVAEYEDWLQSRRSADAKLEELQRSIDTAEWYFDMMKDLKEARYRAASI